MKKIIIYLLSLFLIFSLICIQNKVNADGTNDTNEVISLRDEYSKTYLLSNGDLKKEIYNYPIHYLDSEGIYQDIDSISLTSLSEPDLYEPSGGNGRVIYDTYINSNNPDTNYGTSSILHVNSTSTALIKSTFNFNIDGYVINSASLNIYCYFLRDTQSANVSVYNVNDSWDEDIVTYNTISDYIDDYVIDSKTISAISGSSLRNPMTVSLDITKLVIEWDENNNSNNGLAIKYNSGNNLMIYAYDFGSNSPVMTYIYSQLNTSSYENMLSNYCGFDSSMYNLLNSLYTKLKNLYPNESELKIAWRYSRSLSELCYNTASFNAVSHSIYDDAEDYFENDLDYSMVEYVYLYNSLIGNHTNTLNIDFLHMMYSLSARLSYKMGLLDYTGFASISEQASYLSGWLGDATVVESPNITTSFGNDDYLADLDAENIYRIIINGKDIITALNYYYGHKLNIMNRAEIFLRYIKLDEVVHLVYYYLIDIYLYEEMTGEVSDIYLYELIANEEYHETRLQQYYNDTYKFLQSMRSKLSNRME